MVHPNDRSIGKLSASNRWSIVLIRLELLQTVSRNVVDKIAKFCYKYVSGLLKFLLYLTMLLLYFM